MLNYLHTYVDRFLVKHEEVKEVVAEASDGDLIAAQGFEVEIQSQQD
jgi:hypothetical protein